MTVNDIDVEATIKTAQQLLVEEAQLSAALRTILDMLVQIMAGRLNLNSRNSSKPSSSNRFGKGGKGDQGGAGKKPEVNQGASAPRWKRLIIPM